MHGVLLNATKATFAITTFTGIVANKITTIDNTHWLLIHLYMVQAWKRIPILLCVSTIGVSITSNNIFALVFKILLDFGGLGLEKLRGMLVNMGCDYISVFYGH